MTPVAAAPPVGRLATSRRGRLIGVALLAALTLAAALPGVPGLTRLRFAWLDLCQQMAPRPAGAERVLIVAVDDPSLARYGQWPWPRTRLADLVGAIFKGRPAAVGLDIVMPEPDRLSPPGLPALVPTIGPELAERLAAVPSNDSVLAAALRDRPVVLGMVGLSGGAVASRDAPTEVGTTLIVGGGRPTRLRRFDAVVRSIEEIDRAVRAHGLLDAEIDGGAVRRIALVSEVNAAVLPAIALEMLRVAMKHEHIVVVVDRGRVRGVGTASPSTPMRGDGASTFIIPTQDDGSVWLRYGRRGSSRVISAADVLDHAAAPDMFAGKLVLVGVTAVGLRDRQPIAGGGDLGGVEIHAELVDSILDGALAVLPRWAWGAECAFLLVGGALLILTIPVMRGRATIVVLAPLLLIAFAGSFGLYQHRSLLVDPTTPSVGLVVVFVAMLSLTLTEAERQRRLLRQEVEQQREAAARIEGELSAARRIQMGILPKAADVLAGEPRIDLHIVLEPAREVGGDLYDFFKLDRDRLFFLLGDVSGKGLPGSLFMAISKSLYKSAALRRGAAVATMMREANAEISRDNPEALFVTIFAGVLDVATGTLEYCNAGHDQPYVLSADGGSGTRLSEGGGPPLCVLDDFGYESAACILRPGDTVCLVTDGVTEARNAAGELFGRERLETVLEQKRTDSAAGLAAAIRDAVAQFVGESEPADDLAILVLRWRGPRTVSGR
jgi:adenylate cyclase